MLVNTPRCTGCHPQQRMLWPGLSAAKAENPDLSLGHLPLSDQSLLVRCWVERGNEERRRDSDDGQVPLISPLLPHPTETFLTNLLPKNPVFPLKF